MKNTLRLWTCLLLFSVFLSVFALEKAPTEAVKKGNEQLQKFINSLPTRIISGEISQRSDGTLLCSYLYNLDLCEPAVNEMPDREKTREEIFEGLLKDKSCRFLSHFSDWQYTYLLKGKIMVIFIFGDDVTKEAEKRQLDTPSHSRNKVSGKIKRWKKFSTKGHPKSLGLNIEFEYPENWVAREGKRPHVIQKITDENDEYAPGVIIMVLNGDQDFYEAFKDVKENELTREDVTTNFLPANTKLKGYGLCKMDGEKALWITYTMTSSRGVNEKISMKAISFFIPFRDKVINIMASVGSPTDDVALETAFQNMQKDIIPYLSNSLIILSRY